MYGRPVAGSHEDAGRSADVLRRYRLDGTVSEVGPDELAFTDAEARAVLDLDGAAGRDSDAHRLLALVEGWPAGVRLAAQSLRHADPEAQLSGSVADYVTPEVLDELVETDRDFLLKVSIIGELPPGLGAALTDRPDADQILRRMSAGNTFVQPLADRSGYRLHHLVRQLLATRLTQTQPALVADLHRQAADWFAAHNQPSRRSDTRAKAVTGSGPWAGDHRTG